MHCAMLIQPRSVPEVVTIANSIPKLLLKPYAADARSYPGPFTLKDGAAHGMRACNALKECFNPEEAYRYFELPFLLIVESKMQARLYAKIETHMLAYTHQESRMHAGA